MYLLTFLYVYYGYVSFQDDVGIRDLPITILMSSFSTSLPRTLAGYLWNTERLFTNGTFSVFFLS